MTTLRLSLQLAEENYNDAMKQPRNLSVLRTVFLHRMWIHLLEDQYMTQVEEEREKHKEDWRRAQLEKIEKEREGL